METPLPIPEVIEDRGGGFFRDAGDGGDLGGGGFFQAGDASEFFQQELFAAGRHAGAVIEGAFPHPAAIE